MKNLLIITLFAAALSMNACSSTQKEAAQETAKEPTTETAMEPMEEHAHEAGDSTMVAASYICPMKCEGSASDKPGKCPVCKMDLVAVEETTAQD